MPDNRFNDGKCSPDGRFFAGTISLAKKTGTARLYRLDPDLSVHEAFGPVTNSNGIVWSADGKTCHYIDTPRKEVLAFDYQDGLLLNPRPVIRTGHIDAAPDGMTSMPTATCGSPSAMAAAFPVSTRRPATNSTASPCPASKPPPAPSAVPI